MNSAIFPITAILLGFLVGLFLQTYSPHTTVATDDSYAPEKKFIQFEHPLLAEVVEVSDTYVTVSIPQKETLDQRVLLSFRINPDTRVSGVVPSYTRGAITAWGYTESVILKPGNEVVIHYKTDSKTHELLATAIATR